MIYYRINTPRQQEKLTGWLLDLDFRQWTIIQLGLCDNALLEPSISAMYVDSKGRRFYTIELFDSKIHIEKFPTRIKLLKDLVTDKLI